MRPIFLAVALLAACESATPEPSGPVALAVDPATNFQTATAAEADSLPRAVVAQLYREPSGSITFRLVPELHAQTVVTGPPVTGAIVNAVGVGDCPLEAWNPSAVTDTAGKARIWFEPGTKAGRCKAEIRYTDGVTRMVTDSVIAVVEPGPMAKMEVIAGVSGIQGGAVVWFDRYRTFMDGYDNPIPYSVTASGVFSTVEDQIQGYPSWGVRLAADAEPDDTGTVRFYRGETLLATLLGTLEAHPAGGGKLNLTFTRR